MVITADVEFLGQLESEAESLLERHIATVKEWHPHTLVPWSRGRDFEPDYEWSPEESIVPPEVRSALFVNLLTEDNLPYYFRDIERMFGRDGAWGEWVRRWTAEEGRHAVAIRDYLTVTRMIDPVALERGRMAQMSGGEVPEPPTAADGMLYVTMQELATRISHRNTGARIKPHDRVGYDIMRQVAIDENHHFLFYRGIACAGFKLDPSQMMKALERQLIGFAMPGTGIPEFKAHSALISKAGIYDSINHFRQIVEPVVLRDWDVENVEGLDAEAQAAQERIMAFVEKSRRIVTKLEERREKKAAEIMLVDEGTALATT